MHIVRRGQDCLIISQYILIIILYCDILPTCLAIPVHMRCCLIIMMSRALAVLVLSGLFAAQAAPCSFPGHSLNWILRYCAMSVGSDDETLIRSSPCLAEAQKDSHAANQCSTNEKYKTKMCHEFLMESKKYKSINDCLNDKEIVPYISG